MPWIGVQTLPHTERWPTSSRSSAINRGKGTESTVKDRVRMDIGTGKPLQDWTDTNWKLIKKRVRNLRHRIYRATQNQQWNQVRSLMKLILRSYSNLLLSVRRVTQEDALLRPGSHRRRWGTTILDALAVAAIGGQSGCSNWPLALPGEECVAALR